MSLEDRVGQSQTSPPVRLDADAIGKFVAGIAETNPRHTDAAHPKASAPPLVVAKAIIPGTGAMLMGLGLGAKLMRVVHGSIEIQFGRALVEGDVLRCEATFVGAEEKRTGEVMSFDFDVTDGDGASVSSGVTRYFLRGKSKGEGGPKEPLPDPGPPAMEVVDVVPNGQSLLYAEGSGDRFPIHTDENFAKSVGLPGVILHGMCTLAFATRAIIESVGHGDPDRLGAIAVKFTGMVYHGDTLTHRIWKTDEGVVFTTTNQDGRVVLDNGRAILGGADRDG
jgi:acyl dehydratase